MNRSRRLRILLIVIAGFSLVLSAAACNPADDDDDDDRELTGPGSWIERAPMPTARTSLAAAATGGLVYAMGGFNFLQVPDRPLDVVEIYDPEADSWSVGPPLPEPRGAAAAAVVDGKIYLAGGYAYEGTADWYSARLDVFDPQTGAWTQLPSMPTPRSLPGVAALDGKVFVIAGRNDSGKSLTQVDAVESYDPVSWTWTAMNPLPEPVEAAAATTAGGSLFFAGGWDGTMTGYLNRLLEYDPAGDTWGVGPCLGEVRCSLAAATLWGRYAFFVGGYLDAWPPFRDAVDALDAESGAYVNVAPLPQRRGGAGAATVDGRLFVFGGGDYDEETHTAWNPRSEVWEFVPE